MINSIEKIMLFVGVLFMASCVLTAADKTKDFDCISRDDGTGCCNEHFDLVGGRCLLVIPTIEITWYEARDTCLELDAQLVIIDNFPYFYGELIQLIKDNRLTDRHYWIGASDETIEGDWKWVNGANVSMGPPLWALYYYGYNTYKQEPGSNDPEFEDCGYLDKYRSHYMDDDSCLNDKAFICEQDILQVSSKESPTSERGGAFSKRIIQILQSSEKKQEYQKTIPTK